MQAFTLINLGTILINKLVSGFKRVLIEQNRLVKLYSDPETLFIYQMGKVGSTSFEQALPVAVHIHAFYGKNHTCPVRLKGLSKFGIKHFYYRAKQALLDYRLRRAFQHREQTKIITLVREPMSRNKSMFFHDLDAYLFAAHTNCLSNRAFPIPTRCQDASLLCDVFTEDFDHNYPLTWFDQEFYPMTGIDVFTYPFDSEKGYSIINKANTSVLCLRTDSIATCQEVINKFVGYPVEISSLNSAQTKWYSELYLQFNQQYQPSIKLLTQFKDSKLVQHFFR
jgi:hypothetical protein